MRLTPWVQRPPMLSYFAMSFAISWGGILIILAARGFDLSPMQPLEAGLIFLAMVLGPSVSGIALAASLSGRAGMQDLAARLTQLRVAARWYAVALLTTPTLSPTILWTLSAVVDPAFASRFQWALFAVGLVAGGFEEIGWTGFATPRLLARQTLWPAGLSLGLIWAFWHLLVDFRYNIDVMGAAWPLEFAIVYLAPLTPYRMLITWVYSHTHCLLLAMLMHASFTGWLLVVFPSASPAQSLFWQFILALTLWGLVMMVAHKELARCGVTHERN